MPSKKNGTAKAAKNGKANGHKRGSRKSKAESMTGAKENAVEMRKASDQGEMVLVINDSDFDMHFAALKRVDKVMKSAKSAYDAVCKAAKKVSPDMLSVIKMALKDENGDADEIKHGLEMRGYVLRKIGSPVQLTIFDVLLGTAKEQYYQRGFKDGEASRDANPRCPEGSDLFSEYMTGWRNGQAKLLGVNVNDRPAHVDAAEARADSPDDEDEDSGAEGEEEGNDSDAPVPMELEASPA